MRACLLTLTSVNRSHLCVLVLCHLASSLAPVGGTHPGHTCTHPCVQSVPPPLQLVCRGLGALYKHCHNTRAPRLQHLDGRESLEPRTRSKNVRKKRSAATRLQIPRKRSIVPAVASVCESLQRRKRVPCTVTAQMHMYNHGKFRCCMRTLHRSTGRRGRPQLQLVSCTGRHRTLPYTCSYECVRLGVWAPSPLTAAQTHPATPR